jgi:hypothetical protein
LGPIPGSLENSSTSLLIVFGRNEAIIYEKFILPHHNAVNKALSRHKTTKALALD